MSKGSVPRPIPDRQRFEDAWDRIFKDSDRKKVKRGDNASVKKEKPRF